MNDQMERRFHSSEVRVERRAEGGTRITGHAAVFNMLSDNLGWFREQIKPGFFAEAIGRDDVRGLFNHDPNLVLGRSTTGSLKLEEDSQGLRMEIDPPDTQLARDLIVSIERRDVTGQSFSFSTLEDSWGEDVDGNIIRTLVRIGRLYDVGPVTFPAYPQTDVALRDISAVAVERAKAMLGGRSVDFALRKLRLTGIGFPR